MAVVEWGDPRHARRLSRHADDDLAEAVIGALEARPGPGVASFGAELRRRLRRVIPHARSHERA